ncbi:polyadenylate-binding protein 2-like [Amaranthus tricolor]|uniref:polyadenylate-binding protein 2-like n=1 Tax=Amaranthus tricolor TaxID=29722 RepID=UPI002586B0A3|nr:polyadenylate-binding protein 2-like [Amaranthus tricolor]
MTVMVENVSKTSDIHQHKKLSLYVGDLDPTVNAIDLCEIFCRVGYVTGVRVCYDKLGFSLCYGYVNFSSPLEASKAISLLNHTDLKGKPMRIMRCDRNPFQRKTGNANLYVKNLAPSITSACLDHFFSKFGTVLSCKVAEDNNGKSKGFGFVQFDDEESAMKALTSLNGTSFEGKTIYVGIFMKSSQRNQTFTNLYVKNLKAHVTEDDLKEKFSNFGKVTSSAIMREDHGNSKKFGFVNFESPEDADKALKALNGSTWEQACGVLYVARAVKKTEREKMKKEKEAKWRAATVYVNNLDPNLDESMVKSCFSLCGTVVQAKVLCYSNGISKGFGWVTFSSPSEAITAVARFHGRSLSDKHLNVDNAEHMNGQMIYPISVTHYFPPLSLDRISQGQIFNGNKGLNSYSYLCSANGHEAGTTTAQIQKSKLPKTRGKASDSKLNRKEADLIQIKQSGWSDPVLQQIKVTIMEVLDRKNQTHPEFSPVKPLQPEAKNDGSCSPVNF